MPHEFAERDGPNGATLTGRTVQLARVVIFVLHALRNGEAPGRKSKESCGMTWTVGLS